MGKEININEHFKKQDEPLPEDDERSAFRKIEEEIAHEIKNYEYFQTNGLQINLFKHSEKGVDSTCIMVLKKDKVLYKRIFEGYSDEIRYQCYFFLYRDIFNQGLMMMDKLAIEQEKLDKEMKVVDKVQGSGIVGLDGKKL